MKEEKDNSISDVLGVAAEAGHILLENGAEISRVEETMERISKYYGATDTDFFVLSNGIFTTGSDGSVRNADDDSESLKPRKNGGSYAKVEFIPLKGTQMEKIVEVNALSRDVEQGRYSLEQTREKIRQIHEMPGKPFWEQIAGSAFGSAGFCVLFGGSLFDAAAAFVVGLLLWIVVLLTSRPGLSKVLTNIIGGAFATPLCYAFYKIGFGDNLGNMMIGSLIPLIPGVPFTNGIRDLANEDHLAGMTRLLDAMMAFLGIALGVCMFFALQGHITGSVIELHGSVQNPITSNIPTQTIAAFIGTVGFAVLFGVPRSKYVACGVVAAIGWAFYYALYQFTFLSVFESTFFTSALIATLSRRTAIILQCPVTVFLNCGLFPLIPGAGVFWTTYYTTSNQLGDAVHAGVGAITVTLSIVLAVIIVNGFRCKRKKRWPSFLSRLVNR